MMRRWLVLGLSLGFGAACSPAAAPTVVVSNEVNVVVSDGPSAGSVPPSIDLNDPRIAAAQREIESLLGRPLKFELDRTLVPAFGNGLHAAFVAALEDTVTQLQYCRERQKDAFAFAVAKFRLLRWSYSAGKNPEAPSFEPSAGLLSVLVPPDQYQLLQDYTLVEAFISQVEKERVARYTGMPADKVPPAEFEAYFEFQRHYHRPQPDAKGRTPSSDETELAQLRNVLGLYPRLPAGELQAEARHWLVGRGSTLRHDMTDEDLTKEAKQLLDVQHPRWIRWVNQTHNQFTTDEQKSIADLMFNRHYAPWKGFRKGFNALDFSTPHVRAWLKVRAADKEPEREDPVQQAVVCPYTQHRNDEFLSAASYCNGALYTDLFEQSGGPKKLAQVLLREKGDTFTQTATLHITSQLGVAPAVSLLEALAKDEKASQAALMALAQFSEWGSARSRPNDAPVLDPDPLFELIPSWWQSYPGRRPQLLFLLTQLSNRYEGVVAWPKLSNYLGSRISADELSAYLDQSPRTIWSLGNLAQGLTDGWKRSDLLIPKLEGWLDAYNKGGRDGPEPYYVAERVIGFLCTAGTARDIKALQSFLRQRLESFPSENRNLGSFVEKRQNELCPNLPPEPKPGKKPVLFGD